VILSDWLVLVDTWYNPGAPDGPRQHSGLNRGERWSV